MTLFPGGKRPLPLLLLVLAAAALACHMPIETQQVASPPTPRVETQMVTSPPTETQMIAPVPAPAGAFRVIAYYPSWRAGLVPPEKLPAARLDVLIYAFALPTLEGGCTLDPPPGNPQVFAGLLALKARNPSLTLLLAVGGAGLNEPFSAAVQPERLDGFIAACVQAMRTRGFDGLDVDWEYPSAAQKDTYVALLAGLRQALDLAGQADGRAYRLTAAVPIGPWTTRGLDVARIAPRLDWLNLMTYDLYGSWSETTGLNAPLYTLPSDPQGLSVDSGVKQHLDQGVPAAKLALGVPFYGRAWQGVPADLDGLFQPFEGMLPGLPSGSMRYDQAAALLGGSFTRHWEETGRVPWLYDPAARVMVTYDDPQSVGEKAAYARARGLGGVMIWEITADDAGWALLNSILANR